MSKMLQACPLCGASQMEELFYAKDPHYGIPGSHRVVRCSSCTLVFLNPMFSEEELARLYPEDYYAYQDEPDVNVWKDRAKRILGFWHGTKEPHFDRPGRYLDIGCGSGAEVQRMKEQGWDSYGVEINRAAANVGRAKGLNIFCGSVHEAGYPYAFFDYIRASHSLEHMTDPGDALNEAYRLLKPAGKLLLAVPNIDGLSARIFRQYWWHLCPGVHTYSFSTRTLVRLLNRHSFTIEKLHFNSDYVGILGSLQIWLNRRNGKRSWCGPVFSNHPLRVLCAWLERACDASGLGDMIEATAIKAD